MTTKELKASATRLLEENILSFWITRMTDHERGGYYGQMTGDGRLVKDADKGAILNARLLWTFSAAYRVLGKQEYLDAASRAYNYFIDHFIDHEYGGVYWSVDCNGNALDTKKQFYAIGFAVYGMSEYVRATGSREALDIALQLYDCIEEHSFDHENNGYIEASTREWGEMADMRLSAKDENYPKSQNTHLHIIEPYANLYRCLKEIQASETCNYVPTLGAVLPVIVSVPQETILQVEASLRNIIHIFTDKILNPETHHLDLFFDMDWKRMSIDESYGHDIECSWLLHEAALVLGDPYVLEKVEPIVRMVAKASEKGLNSDGSMSYEWKADGGLDTDRHWWVQAENVVGWMNIYQHFGDTEALRRALHCYDYILNNLVDRDGGEWYWSCAPDGTPNRRDDKAGFWKCPYHNGRMCLEIIERYETL
jgi:mannobiose 2-epimerase